MEKRKLILFIAMSLDGYIADQNQGLEFLDTVQKQGEDYGYTAFSKTVDTIIIGRKTYEKVLSFGGKWPYGNKKCFVLSNSLKGEREHVILFSGNPATLIEDIRQKPGKNIYCDGGAEVINSFLQEGLIDELTISVIPILLGSGIRLFQQGRPMQKLQLKSSRSYPSGLVQLSYVRV